MVSEHASPLAASAASTPAGRTCTSPRWPRRWRAAGTRSSCTPGATTRPARAGRDGPAASTVDHVTPGRRPRCPRTTCCRTWPTSRADLRRRGAPRRPDVVHAHFWMSGLRRARTPRGSSTSPCVQTFHALGSVKRRHQGAPTPAPPSGSARAARSPRDVDRVIATCSDEVSELLRLGADRRRDLGRPVRGGRRALHPGRRRRGRRPAAPRLARRRPAGAAQGRGQRHPRRSRRRARRRARRRRRPAAADARRRPGGAAAARARRAPGRRRPGAASSARVGRARDPRAAALAPTSWCASPGTSRSASCRSRRWPAACPWSPPPSAACIDTVVDGMTGDAGAAPTTRRGSRRRCARCSATRTAPRGYGAGGRRAGPVRATPGSASPRRPAGLRARSWPPRRRDAEPRRGRTWPRGGP